MDPSMPVDHSARLGAQMAVAVTCVYALVLPVPLPGLANVQTLRGLCHLHLLLHLSGPDARLQGVSRTGVPPAQQLRPELTFLPCLVSPSRHKLGVSFGVSVCVLLLTLAVCYSGQLQVSVAALSAAH